MKSYRMKFMVILLALLMCVCLVDTHALVADETNEPVYESGDLTYTFTLQGSWNSGYNASIRIDNHSAQPIEDWRFEMEYAGSISNIWNAVIESNADGKYIIKNAGWNQDIAAGSYVEFGLSGAEAFDKYPSSYTMLTGIAANSSEDFTAVFEITNDWTQGFTGRITITNNTDAVIEDWVLEFDGENEISTLWDGEIVSHEGIHYIVKSADYNQNIPAGGSVSFNFNVDFRSSDAEFTNFALSSYADLSQQTNPGDDDNQEPEDFDDIGEAYYKESSPEDFVTDEETGLRYVRNQLIVSAYVGLDKSVMEDICEEIGAKIVGYIAIVNDYQIEFNEDKTLDDLAMIAEYLDSYSFIRSVTLNLSCPVGFEATSDDTLYNDGKSWQFNTPDSWDESNPAGDTWGLATLKVFSAWDYKNSFVSVKVGVYDDGFVPNHPDLRISHLKNNTDDRDHGTHVAGIIAAEHNNAKGISGVATNVELYCYGTADKQEEGVMRAKKGFAHLIGNNVKVINISAHLGTSDELTMSASHPELGKKSQDARDQIDALASDMEDYLQQFVEQGYDFVICNSAGNRNDTAMKIDPNATYGVRHFSQDELKGTILESEKISGVNAKYNSVFTAIPDGNIKDRIIIVGNLLSDGNTYASSSSEGDRVDVAAPGDKILSTVTTSKNATGYEHLGGTSMSTPHIAGIVALMYQANPGIRASNVKKYLKESASRYVSRNGYSYAIPDACKCVERVRSIDNSAQLYGSWPSGQLIGTTSPSNVSFTAYRKSSGDYNVGTYEAGVYSFAFNSDGNGDFTTVLPQGIYDITVYKAEYLPFCIQNVTINPDETTYLEPISLTKWSQHPLPQYGTSVQGIITNAITGEPVNSVTVNLRKGWNNTTGSYAKDIYGRVRSATTDTNGKFSCNVAVGSYTAEILKDGYVTGYYNVISADNSSVSGNQYTMVISPVLSENEYRTDLGIRTY